MARRPAKLAFCWEAQHWSHAAVVRVSAVVIQADLAPVLPLGRRPPIQRDTMRRQAATTQSHRWWIEFRSSGKMLLQCFLLKRSNCTTPAEALGTPPSWWWCDRLCGVATLESYVGHRVCPSRSRQLASIQSRSRGLCLSRGSSPTPEGGSQATQAHDVQGPAARPNARLTRLCSSVLPRPLMPSYKHLGKDREAEVCKSCWL